jgi:hypothetical protein
MSKLEKFSRIIVKRSNETGVYPTIPASGKSDDHTTLPAWDETDIYAGEFFLNQPDEKLWIRFNNNTIKQSLFYEDLTDTVFTGIVNMSGATSVELPDGYLEKYGTNYIIVSGKGTPSKNATELKSAYDAAKAKSPSATNVITVVVAPGNYGISDTLFSFDASYIDVLSLTGNADIIIQGRVDISGQYSYFRGFVPRHFNINTNLPSIILENCILNTVSDNLSDINSPINSTFINCNINGGIGTNGGNMAAKLIDCTINVIDIGNGIFTGLAENCTLKTGTFPTTTETGKIVNCIDSTGNVINSTKVSVADGVNANDVVNKGQLDALKTPNLNKGVNYLMVYGIGTPTENATELQTVYNAAKAKSPSVSNVITIVVAPGNYDFGATSFVHDTAYIDIVSLTGNEDVLFSSTEEANAAFGNNYGIKVTANNTFVKGINCGTNNFYIAGSLNYLTCVNCTGGNGSFGGSDTASGTFTNCTGGNGSFGGRGTALGTFTNCTGGDYSFGSHGTASGPFTNCTGGDYSFGGYGTASGTFTNCIGGDCSFAGDYGTITSIARLYYCRLTSGTFPAPAAGGKIVLCIDGSNSVVTI